MTLKAFLLILTAFIGQNVLAQTMDTTIYWRFLKVDKDEFVSCAKSYGLTSRLDTPSQAFVVKARGCRYGKPLNPKIDNEYYDVALYIATPYEENKTFILKNATETQTKGTWTDKDYLYQVADVQNARTKETSYQVVIFKRKK